MQYKRLTDSKKPIEIKLENNKVLNKSPTNVYPGIPPLSLHIKGK